MLNEECVRGGGNDEGFVNKAESLHKTHAAFSRRKTCVARLGVACRGRRAPHALSDAHLSSLTLSVACHMTLSSRSLGRASVLAHTFSLACHFSDMVCARVTPRKPSAHSLSPRDTSRHRVRVAVL